MRPDRYLAKSRIIDIKSTDLKGALEELLEVATDRMSDTLTPSKLLKALIRREDTMTTCLGNGVALPHIRVKMKRRYIFAIGRCPDGVEYDGLPEYKEVRLIFLLIASDEDKNYLNNLASLARLFKEKEVVDRIVEAPDIESFRDNVYLAFGGAISRPQKKQTRFNRLLLKESEKIARESKCSAILVFSDTFEGGIEVTPAFPKFRTIVVSRSGPDRFLNHDSIETVISVRSFSNSRLSQLRSAVLIGLSRGIFKYSDRLCCVGGVPSSNQLDTLTVVDVEREFQSVLNKEGDLLPATVKVEVLERIFGIAIELAVEGREGKPVGCIFVVGDVDKVHTMVKPLILNPFYGYRQEDRNVLNPFMDETIKEFSSIDGAFIIRGNGTIESAGTLLNAPPEFHDELPSGLGARHAAGAAMSRATNCIAIVVSSSTGQVSLFRRGVMFPLVENGN